MKKITLLFALLISSIGFSQTYDLLESFNGTGLEGGFGGTTVNYSADPQPAKSSNKVGGQVYQINSSPTGDIWQGANVTLPTNYTLTAATQLTMQLEVYSTAAITIAPKAQGGVSGAPDSVTSVDHAGNGWETLTFTFDKSLDGKIPANGNYGDFALHINWDTNANGYGAPDSRVLYIRNLKGLSAAPPVVPAPLTAAPTPPTRNSADVISLFSSAYTNIAVSEWGTSWDEADIEDFVVEGDTVKKITFVNFVGVDFSSAPQDLTNFTHFHIDLWTATETLDKSFNHKFSNHANGSSETSAIEFSTTNASSPSLPNPNPGTWISYDIPLSTWGVANSSLDREAIAQYLITSNLGVAYVDNIYVYRASTASVDNNELLGFSMYPNPATNKLNIAAKETIQNADVFNVLGKKVMSVNVNDTKASIDVSNLSSGIYLIKYNVNNTVGTAKFIKQ